MNDLTDQGAAGRPDRAALPAAARRGLGAAGEGPALRVGLDPEGRHRQARGHARAGAAGGAVRRDRHGRAARGPVALGPGLPALRPPAGGLRRRGDGRRVGQGNEIQDFYLLVT